MALPEEDISAGSILRELVVNQYQAILLGGTALVSLIALNPLPLLFWFGSELVLLPILDSGPIRRLVHRRRAQAARAAAAAARARIVAGLSPESAERYAAMDELCRLIEANHQSLTGISQAYLAEQRGKLDMVLQGCLHRLMAIARYERMPDRRNPGDIQREIAALERELARPGLPERAAAAIRKNLELKQRLLTSIADVGETVKTLQTELDSMESLLEVLHQNSIALRDPQAISEELDTIVRQAEDSEKVVREMEALLRQDTGGWPGDLVPDADVPIRTSKAPEIASPGRQKMRGR